MTSYLKPSQNPTQVFLTINGLVPYITATCHQTSSCRSLARNTTYLSSSPSQVSPHICITIQVEYKIVYTTQNSYVEQILSVSCSIQHKILQVVDSIFVPSCNQISHRNRVWTPRGGHVGSWPCGVLQHIGHAQRGLAA